GMPFWISVVRNPQRICSPVRRRHLMRRIKNGSGTRVGASAAVKPPLSGPTFRAHGMTGKMPVWGWQRPRCSRIWKKPVNWPPGTGPNGTHHS
ncbi:phage tail tape measure protein, partial [Escherichia coli]